MARDIIHNSVRQALENEGFSITQDPYILELVDDDAAFQIDLSAVRQANRHSKPQKIIAIEVKSFAGLSPLHAFHEALGQYLCYRDAIRENAIPMKLYLAVSAEGWRKLGAIHFVQRRIKQYRLKFIIVEIESKKVLQWIN